jgi:S1-C subfamily serine protease
MRTALTLALLTVLSVFAVAQEILIHKKPDPSIPPFAVQLKRTVIDIELSCKRNSTMGPVNDGVGTFGGTGFLVTYPAPGGLFFHYLVTNRHVALCWDEDNRPQDVRSVSLRVNTKDRASKIIKLSDNGNVGWRIPEDDSVDIAVTPITPADDWEVSTIPVDAFATKAFLSTNNVAEGSQILLSGYFYQFPGNRRVEPIVRQGILSMIPDEPMMTTTGKIGNVYLGDVHIFGGNSGSPVMVAADALAIGGYRLIGVVSGYYYEDADFNLEIATTVRGKTKANSGIAMIVPADLLHDLLERSDLKGPRDAYQASVSHR